MSDYLFSIGGTANRIMEAVLHLCECGHFVSNILKILIIDADENNGNKLVTEEVINSYVKCRRYYYKNGSTLFKTDIQPVFKKGSIYNNDNVAKYQYVTSPVASNKKVYKIEDDMVKANKETTTRAAINLMKALYSEEDYKRDIKGGFYSHPQIGALMFERWIEEISDDMENLLDGIRLEAANEHVNIFIVASSFGGTGASGFPAIAKMIRDSVAQKDNPERIHISGCFILPYFKVENQAAGNRIDFTLFNESTKNSLTYYKEHESAKLFDSIYILGSNEGIVRGSYNDIGEKQINWPHYVELYAALAADHYFRRKYTDKYNPITDPDWLGYETNSKSASELNWNDFPLGEELRKSLSRFLMFNILYVPCVMKNFLTVNTANNEPFKFETMPTTGNDCVKWPPIKTNDFGYTVFYRFKFKQDFNIDLFTALFLHFNHHIKWLNRMICKYNNSDDIKKQCTEREMRSIFGDNEKGRNAFQRRYEMALGSNDFNKLYLEENYTDKSESYSYLLSNIKLDNIHEKNNDTIFAVIDRLKKNYIGNTEDAVRDIIQNVYNAISNLIK